MTAYRWQPSAPHHRAEHRGDDDGVVGVAQHGDEVGHQVQGEGQVGQQQREPWIARSRRWIAPSRPSPSAPPAVGGALPGVYSSDLNVYPNPSMGNVSIESEGLDLAKARVTVRDILGRTVPAAITVNGNARLEADLTAQPAGTYFISIVSGNDVVTKKIQIIK